MVSDRLNRAKHYPLWCRRPDSETSIGAAWLASGVLLAWCVAVVVGGRAGRKSSPAPANTLPQLPQALPQSGVAA